MSRRMKSSLGDSGISPCSPLKTTVPPFRATTKHCFAVSGLPVLYHDSSQSHAWRTPHQRPEFEFDSLALQATLASRCALVLSNGKPRGEAFSLSRSRVCPWDKNRTRIRLAMFETTHHICYWIEAVEPLEPHQKVAAVVVSFLKRLECQ